MEKGEMEKGDEAYAVAGFRELTAKRWEKPGNPYRGGRDSRLRLNPCPVDCYVRFSQKSATA